MERADAALMRASAALDGPDWLSDALTDLQRGHTALEEATGDIGVELELEAANRRIAQLDDVIARKNIIIRLLALGDAGYDATITAALIADEHSLQ